MSDANNEKARRSWSKVTWEEDESKKNCFTIIIDDKYVAGKIFQLYNQKWKITTTFSFKKDENFSWEDIERRVVLKKEYVDRSEARKAFLELWEEYINP
jgi:hypothetical protein